MGAILKYIFVGYLIYLVLKYFGRLFTGGIQPEQARNPYSNQRNGSVNIKTKPKNSKNKHVEGGEYIDFEEVE